MTQAQKALAAAFAENPSSKWMLIDGYPFATADFSVHDGDDRPVALFDGPRGWIFLERADAERRDRRIGRGGGTW